MSQTSNGDIAALLGSRICHDLISPIGAVGNGLELLNLSGVPKGPEMELLSDSAANAKARVTLFRLAFGLAAPEQITRADEICTPWAAAQTERALKLDWAGADSLPRPLAQALVLALMCLEKALPLGGLVHITHQAGQWTLAASGPDLRHDVALWDMVAGGAAAQVDPAHVQFLLLPHSLSEQGRHCDVRVSGDHLKLSF